MPAIVIIEGMAVKIAAPLMIHDRLFLVVRLPVIKRLLVIVLVFFVDFFSKWRILAQMAGSADRFIQRAIYLAGGFGLCLGKVFILGVQSPVFTPWAVAAFTADSGHFRCR